MSQAKGPQALVHFNSGAMKRPKCLFGETPSNRWIIPLLVTKYGICVQYIYMQLPFRAFMIAAEVMWDPKLWEKGFNIQGLSCGTDRIQVKGHFTHETESL